MKYENKGHLRKGISHGHLATRWDFRRSRWPTFLCFDPQTSHRLHFGLEMSITNLIVQGVKFHACLAYEIVPPDANTVPTINQATVQFNCNFPNVPNIAISFN